MGTDRSMATIRPRRLHPTQHRARDTRTRFLSQKPKDKEPLEYVNAGVATVVGLIALASAYTSIVQQFDEVRAGQKALEAAVQETRAATKENRLSLEAGQQDSRVAMRELKAEFKQDLRDSQMQFRDSQMQLALLTLGGFVSLGYVVRKP